jgi:mannose-6-phosphate isomerase
VKRGDVFFLPARRVHAIGPGILLAEIQQTSDITYRIYDFDRIDADGKGRELHTDLAVDSIDYNHHNSYRTDYSEVENQTNEVVSCPYFTTGTLFLSEPTKKDIKELDCFMIYMCVEGGCTISSSGNEDVSLTTGESVLLPASLFQFEIKPDPNTKLLEVYIPHSINQE